jgi:glycosyltransferase 2 family protein
MPAGDAVSAAPGGRAGWRRVVSFVFVATAFLFLGAVAGRNVGALRAHDWSVRPLLLLASLLLHVAALAWGVRVWQLLLRRMEVRVGFLDLARVWFVSGLGRYIPGKIWQFVGAAHLGSSAGIPAAVAVASLAAHTGFFLIGALVTAIWLLPDMVGALVGIPLAPLRWMAPLLLILVHPLAIRAGLSLFRRTTRKPLADWSGRWLDGVWLTLLAVVGWVATGAALFLFLLSLTPLPSSALPAIVGIHAVAFVFGYAVFVAPAGLGAREGALAALLSLFVATPVAALLAVAARLWTIAAEVAPALALLRLPAGGAPLPPAARPTGARPK